MTAYKLSTLIVNSLSAPVYTEKVSSSRKQEAAQQTSCYAHGNGTTATRPKLLTPIIGPQCTINNSTTVPTTKQQTTQK